MGWGVFLGLVLGGLLFAVKRVLLVGIEGPFGEYSKINVIG